MRWLGDITDSMDMSLTKPRETVEDRKGVLYSMGSQRVGHEETDACHINCGSGEGEHISPSENPYLKLLVEGLWRERSFFVESYSSVGGGNGNLLPYPCLENPMNREATGHGVAKSRTRLRD